MDPSPLLLFSHLFFSYLSKERVMQHTVHPYFTELPLKKSGHCVIYYNNCKDAQFKQGEPMS